MNLHTFHLLIKNPATTLLHIAFLVIIAGALVTHFFGVTGKLSLTGDSNSIDNFTVESGPSDGHLPFSIEMVSAETLFQKSSTTPADFKTVFRIIRKGGATETAEVSMNRVAVVDNWRFYQTGMGDNESTLSVSHDPVGIGITYTGYCLLIIAMILFFFQPGSAWRAWIKRLSTPAAVILFLLCPSISPAAETPSTLPRLQRPLAENFGDVYVYWNDRVVPVQTMAIDVSCVLYDSKGYKDMTPLQVLTGWLFYYDDWKRDYDSTTVKTGLKGKALKRQQERDALTRWLGTGEAFRIYPYHASTGRLEWLSLAGRRPSDMDMNQWKFMLEAMPRIASDIYSGQNIRANRRITELIEQQKKYAGKEFLPSDTRMRAEKFYNGFVSLIPVAVILMLTGILTLVCADFRKRKYMHTLCIIISAVCLIYLLAIMALRGFIAAHVPLSNGFETMLAMATASLICALFFPRRYPQLTGGMMIVAGAAVAVAAMGNSHPQIGALMPVLNSRLLSLHVMLVMLSYSLLFLIAVLSAKVLIEKQASAQKQDATLIHVLLLPAVFLLTAGIFIGAVWANQSWGRYWGWDPKETCALITMLVYAVPLHTRSLKFLRNDKTLALYTLAAFGCVIFTYFGANYLLPGLHSYA